MHDIQVMEKKEFQFEGVKVIVHKPNESKRLEQALKDFYNNTKKEKKWQEKNYKMQFTKS